MDSTDAASATDAIMSGSILPAWRSDRTSLVVASEPRSCTTRTASTPAGGDSGDKAGWSSRDQTRCQPSACATVASSPLPTMPWEPVGVHANMLHGL